MYIRIAAILGVVVLVLLLTNCTSSGNKYWGQVATGVGETTKR